MTIEIGANDACTRTTGEMTTKDAFKANVESRSRPRLRPTRPRHPQVFVAERPEPASSCTTVNKASTSARLTWGLLRICQSMLANPTSTRQADVDRRDVVQARVNEYNAALAEVCTARRQLPLRRGRCRHVCVQVVRHLDTGLLPPVARGQATLAARHVAEDAVGVVSRLKQLTRGIPGRPRPGMPPFRLGS